MSHYVSTALRQRAQERALFRCEYCLLHQDDGWVPHVPDHVIALRHGGETLFENLAWACFDCNHLKGSDLASIDLETGRVVRLFHPRRDRWSRHFRLRGGHIIPLTAIGRATEYHLQFNRPEIVVIRKALIMAGRYPRQQPR